MRIFTDRTPTDYRDEKIKSLEADIDILKYDIKTLKMQLQQFLDYQQRTLNEFYTELNPLPAKMESLDRRMIEVTQTVFYEKLREKMFDDVIDVEEIKKEKERGKVEHD